MLGVQLVNIADNERGLLFKKNSFKRVLEPGRYRFLGFKLNVRVEVYDVTKPELKHSLGRFLVTTYADEVNRYIDSVDVKDNEIGITDSFGNIR